MKLLLHLLTSLHGTNANYPNVRFRVTVGVIADVTQTALEDRW
jgi:hypothetical protein